MVTGSPEVSAEARLTILPACFSRLIFFVLNNQGKFLQFQKNAYFCV